MVTIVRGGPLPPLTAPAPAPGAGGGASPAVGEVSGGAGLSNQQRGKKQQEHAPNQPHRGKKVDIKA